MVSRVLSFGSEIAIRVPFPQRTHVVVQQTFPRRTDILENARPDPAQYSVFVCHSSKVFHCLR